MMSETNYHLLYGSVSTAATASIIYAYAAKARGRYRCSGGPHAGVRLVIGWPAGARACGHVAVIATDTDAIAGGCY